MTAAPFPWKPRVCPCYHHSMEPEAGPRHFLVVVTRSRLQRRLVTRVVPMVLYKPGLTTPLPPLTALQELRGPGHSPNSTAKPILQSMAGNSIQAVIKDEWGPPMDRKQRMKEPARRAGGRAGDLRPDAYRGA